MLGRTRAAQSPTQLDRIELLERLDELIDAQTQQTTQAIQAALLKASTDLSTTLGVVLAKLDAITAMLGEIETLLNNPTPLVQPVAPIRYDLIVKETS